MLGALVSAGASLLGGLFSMSSEKKRDKANAAAAAASNKRNEERVATMNADVRARAESAASAPIVTNQQGGVDVASMMQGAEDAGINPITWLRNGGMQAYAHTSQQVWNSQLMDAALAGSSIFQESAAPIATARGPGEVIGSALVSGAGQWVADANQDRQNQFQMAMLQAQLNGQNANAASLHGDRSGYVPTAFLGGSVTLAKNSAVLERAYKEVVWNDPNTWFPKRQWVLDQSVVPDPEIYATPPVVRMTQGATRSADPFARAGELIIDSWMGGTEGQLRSTSYPNPSRGRVDPRTVRK